MYKQDTLPVTGGAHTPHFYYTPNPFNVRLRLTPPLYRSTVYAQCTWLVCWHGCGGGGEMNE